MDASEKDYHPVHIYSCYVQMNSNADYNHLYYFEKQSSRQVDPRPNQPGSLGDLLWTIFKIFLKDHLCVVLFGHSPEACPLPNVFLDP